ncbi:hypothetical protein FUAX_26420 [Fulvitalea axinellae]|uniref:Uncharacterized protein n=1 Tax=Fulvitalea axinellae TaxID=1182444 RepID=A0AAU9DGN9_9BACT|nr:hypothetical protein FUAX_26420 [Fulvitalea axinellae]
MGDPKRLFSLKIEKAKNQILRLLYALWLAKRDQLILLSSF